MLFYTLNGVRTGSPFQWGTLCVGPTGARRTAVRSAGGNPSPALGIAGTSVHGQFWARDRGFPAPCNSTLTNALQYAVAP